MQSNCGECDKPFTALCETQLDCDVHHAKCFSCKQCKDTYESQHSGSEQCQIETDKCDLCERLDQRGEFYFDWHCEKYICRFHFIGIELVSKQIRLPCGCCEAIEQILSFTSHFCILCGRKNSNCQQNQLGCCVSCQRRQFKQTQAQPIKIPLKVQKSQQQIQNQRLNKSIQIYKQQIQFYKNEIFLLQQNMKVSEFARNEIKKAICDNERDKQCSICLQHFNQTTKKPIMVCLQQHLVCQKCLDPKLNLVNCPLCKQPIQRSKVLVSRQRNKTLLLQNIICQPYSYKLKKCIQMKQVEMDESQAKQQEKQTQTDVTRINRICSLQFISTNIQKQKQKLKNSRQSSLDLRNIKRQQVIVPRGGRKILKK